MTYDLTITWDQYAALDLDAKTSLINDHKSYLGNYFDAVMSGNTAWALFAGQELEPRLTGVALNNSPDEELCIEIGQALDKPVFVYSRAHIDLF